MLGRESGIMDPEEQELQNDYRYRSYAAVIEKALRNFESSSEWADLISSLGKLNKVWMARLVQYIESGGQTSRHSILLSCTHGVTDEITQWCIQLYFHPGLHFLSVFVSCQNRRALLILLH